MVRPAVLPRPYIFRRSIKKSYFLHSPVQNLVNSTKYHKPHNHTHNPAEMATTSVKTAIPSNVTEASLIQTLHDHQSIIDALAPGNTATKLISGDPAIIGQPTEYSVTAPTPVGTSTYPLTITNVADGVDTLVQPKPPVGKLEIKAKWRVANGQLTEDVEIDGNFMTKRQLHLQNYRFVVT